MSKTSYRRNRCGRIRWLDRPLSAARWGASHFSGCLGTRQFACFFRRRDAYHPRSLRARSALYKTRSARDGALEGARVAVEKKILLSHWRFVDGPGFGRVRTRIAASAQRRRNSLRTTFSQRDGTPLAAFNFDQIAWGIYEPQSGYLLARASAQAVVEHFVARAESIGKRPSVCTTSRAQMIEKLYTKTMARTGSGAET